MSANKQVTVAALEGFEAGVLKADPKVPYYYSSSCWASWLAGYRLAAELEPVVITGAVQGISRRLEVGVNLTAKNPFTKKVRKFTVIVPYQQTVTQVMASEFTLQERA